MVCCLSKNGARDHLQIQGEDELCSYVKIFYRQRSFFFFLPGSFWTSWVIFIPWKLKLNVRFKFLFLFSNRSPVQTLFQYNVTGLWDCSSSFFVINLTSTCGISTHSNLQTLSSIINAIRQVFYKKFILINVRVLKTKVQLDLSNLIPQ